MRAPLVTRARPRRGAFGLDGRRAPDPARAERELRALLAERFPEVLVLPSAPDAAGGRTLLLLSPAAHPAVLRVERDPRAPGPAAAMLRARCRALGVPHAAVSSAAEGRAALRRLGVEPRPAPGGRVADPAFGGR